MIRILKYRVFLFVLTIFFIAEFSLLAWFIAGSTDRLQSSVEVNAAVQSVQADWREMGNHRNVTGLDYTVLDNGGTVLFQTREGLSESVNEAVIHGDTILDIKSDEASCGKILIWNDIPQLLKSSRNKTAVVIALAAVFQCAGCAAYLIFLNRTVIRPFWKLERFAESVAGGNLDIPLEMDRQNIFGAFTESFDIMRAELKKARIAEAKANASKKELVAKLSHDIRTPVASIQAAAELGAAIAESEKNRQNYTHIIHKADQINMLVTNLFQAALEDLQKLSVVPTDIESAALLSMLKSADYFHYAEIPEIPDCLIVADRLRLQQVFDNIFSNSYKYADTKIDVGISLTGRRLAVTIEDYGNGVPKKELPLLKEKFWRGKNAEHVEGAGLGLYISDCFMNEMGGGLVIENGRNGLSVTVWVALSGTI